MRSFQLEPQFRQLDVWPGKSVCVNSGTQRIDFKSQDDELCKRRPGRAKSSDACRAQPTEVLTLDAESACERPATEQLVRATNLAVSDHRQTLEAFAFAFCRASLWLSIAVRQLEREICCQLRLY